VLNDPIGTRHSGDLPNITTDKNGVAEVRYYPNA
jgi:Cu/Zn superoxide dismutase